MKKLLHSFAILFFLATTQLYCEIKETSTLTPLQEALEKADPNTLVLFDVDEEYPLVGVLYSNVYSRKESLYCNPDSWLWELNYLFL